MNNEWPIDFIALSETSSGYRSDCADKFKDGIENDIINSLRHGKSDKNKKG